MLGMLYRYLPEVERAPSANTGRLWLMRIGLHELSREKEKADDWVWMMDHTIQLGRLKCLVIIGIRLSCWLSSRSPLRHEDMTLLNLTPMEQSTGERVHEQLCATMRTTGAPCAILSDGGTDLKRGMEFLHKRYPEIHHLLDIKHKNALFLKKELQNDRHWGAFVKQANNTKLAVSQTPLAFLTPPSLKTKARYMNLDTLVSWGVRALKYVDHPHDLPGQPTDRAKLKEKLGWLRQYRRSLKNWSELLAIVRAVEEYVHTEGFHPAIREELEERLKPMVTTAPGRRLRKAQLEFVTEQSARLNEGQRIIGSTEILESIIGKYKRLQSTHSKGGMTAMLLSIGVIVGKQLTDTIQQALQSVSTQDVTAWCKKHLGNTMQSQRKLAFNATKTG